MEMEARRAFAAAQQEVWDTLHDPEALKACLPGCETFEVLEPGHHKLDWLLKLGAGNVRFDGNVYLIESVPPERYRVDFDGDGGVAGSGKGSALARLIPLPDYAPGHPRCQLHYSVSASLDGNITKIDSRLVDAAAAGLAEQFFRRFDEQLRRRYQRAPLAELSAAQADRDEEERAGASTMMLEPPSRAAAPVATHLEADAPKAASWAWAAGVGCVALVAAAVWWMVG